MARASFTQLATSNDSTPGCLGPVEPSSCQTEQDLLGANFSKVSESIVPWLKRVLVPILLGIDVINGPHDMPPPVQLGQVEETLGEQVVKGEKGETGDTGTGQGGPSSLPIFVGGDEPGITVTTIGPPAKKPPEEEEEEEEETGEDNSSSISPPFLPGVIGDFGPGSVIDTGWLLWGW